MKTADDWKEYKILATANGMKKENWNGVVLLRPDPQVIWQGADLDTSDVNAVYRRSDRGGGYWDVKKQFPPEWVIAYKDLRFKVKPMGFKQIGRAHV